MPPRPWAGGGGAARAARCARATWLLGHGRLDDGDRAANPNPNPNPNPYPSPNPNPNQVTAPPPRPAAGMSYLAAGDHS